MSLLDALFMPMPAGMSSPRRESPLGEWPAFSGLTPAQRAQRAAARQAQIGKPKAPNRVRGNSSARKA